jgi:hypothetical protein
MTRHVCRYSLKVRYINFSRNFSVPSTRGLFLFFRSIDALFSHISHKHPMFLLKSRHLPIVTIPVARAPPRPSRNRSGRHQTPSGQGIHSPRGREYGNNRPKEWSLYDCERWARPCERRAPHARRFLRRKTAPTLSRAESQQSALGTHARRNVVAREGLRARA